MNDSRLTDRISARSTDTEDHRDTLTDKRAIPSWHGKAKEEGTESVEESRRGTEDVIEAPSGWELIEGGMETS